MTSQSELPPPGDEEVAGLDEKAVDAACEVARLTTRKSVEDIIRAYLATARRTSEPSGDAPAPAAVTEATDPPDEEVAGLVAELNDMANDDDLGPGGDEVRRAIEKAASTLIRLLAENNRLAGIDAALQFENAALRAEVDEARRYCSAAAHDYEAVLVFLETEIGHPFEAAFKSASKEMRETSEFLRLASEGRANGTVYADELSAEKIARRAAEAALAKAREALHFYAEAGEDGDWIDGEWRTKLVQDGGKIARDTLAQLDKEGR